MVENKFDSEYHKTLQHILDNGVRKQNRTGVETIGVFGYQARYDMRDGTFPLLTTKKVFLRSIIHELLWFLRGETNIKYLVDNNVGIWNEWPFQAYLKANDLEEEFPKYSDKWSEKLKWYVEQVKEDSEFAKKWGELGPVYGRQWRNFGGFDQIKDVVDQIRNNPDSRRMIVCAWNPPEIPEMAKSGLPPCHCLFQFYVAEGKLSCQLYQRSCDTFLGVPFNIASYALLTMIIAKITGLEVGEFVHTSGDLHIYHNHVDQIKEQLSRDSFAPPKMKINGDQKEIEDFKFEDFEIVEYESHGALKAPIAV